MLSIVIHDVACDSSCSENNNLINKLQVYCNVYMC